jgi:5-methylcytosine-specific restriction endonuclease McrA
MHQLRQLDEYKKWRMDCLKRDWFRCQECFTKDNLEVHHIKSFTELVIECLQEYNQFSPIEDKETLFRLATKSSNLWDINNGKTLCEHHHKSLTMKLRSIK